MLIFRQSGQLGNQIFQYAALRSLCEPEEELVLLGFSDLQSTFNIIDAKIINVDHSILKRIMYYKLFPNLLNWLSDKSLITNISEGYHLSQYELIKKEGIFNSIKFVNQAYFQNETLLCPEVIKNLVFRSDLLSKTKHLLKVISPSNTNIFVHIRRGDYLFWPSKENPAVLPAKYYRKCIDYIYSHISNPFFIFTSDDPLYVRDFFGDLKNSYISKSSAFEDFVLMSHCSGGILSASSFSWWSAYFAQFHHPKGIFLAPKYWVGHLSKTWYPSTIESSFLSYIDF